MLLWSLAKCGTRMLPPRRFLPRLMFTHHHSTSAIFPMQSGLPARFGGFLPSSVTEGFDISLFGLSGGEAELMDPQQRLLLEVSLEVRAHCLL